MTGCLIDYACCEVYGGKQRLPEEKSSEGSKSKYHTLRNARGGCKQLDRGVFESLGRKIY